MARDNPAELGLRRPSAFRYGPGVPLLGHRRRGDPGATVLPQFALLENVRFRDGISGRPGADARVELTPGSATTFVSSIFDFQITGDGGLGKLYCVYDGCPGISSSAGFSLNWYDVEQDSPFARGVYYPTATALVLAVHDGILYIGVDDTLRAFVTVLPDYEDESLFIGGVDQSEILKQFAGFTVTCMYSAFGELFIGLDGGAGASKIVRYDGVTFRDDDTAINPPTTMRMFRDELLVVGIGAPGSGLRERTADGTWSPVAGAGLVGAVAIEEYRDELYISEASPDLWKYDGTTLAVDRTIVGATISGLAKAFGYLFYGYLSSTPEGIIGRLDSAGTYVDAHKNLTTQDATLRLPKALRFYRGDLVAAVNSAAAGGKLAFSPGSATSGTWTVVISNAANNGEIIAFEVF